MRSLPDYLSSTPPPRLPSLLILAVVWGILFALDPWLDLGNLSLILLTGSVAASLWLAPVTSIIVSTASVIAFDWLFVPPRGSFHVDQSKHLMLLVTMIVVNGLIALLMELHRRTAVRANDQRLRNALLVSVSHDFRTPLSVIIGTAANLAQRSENVDDPTAKKMAGVIHTQSSRLSHIVDNVLHLVRLDANVVRLKRDWESPEEIIGTAVRLSRQWAADRTIIAAVPTGLPLLWCDAVLIVQLLENLIDNSLKYSPASEPISVSADWVENSVCFRVEDHGTGIAMDIIERIAKGFKHGEPALTAMAIEGSRTGAGIGLTLCMVIARLHDASIQLTPREGGGAVFTLFMPVRANLIAPTEQPL